MEIIALYSVLWACFHLGAGTLAQQVPVRRFVDLPFVSRSYAWEHSGRLYERLGIRWWKDHIPEAGAFCPGGFPKRQLQSDDPDYLRLFVLEASRAEFSHWMTWGLALTFFLWTPWPIAVFMVFFGAMGNGPCIMVQRYNRIRLNRVLRASERRAHRDRAALPAHAVAHQGEIQ
ncbi:hypothetical protein [uncultured Thiodictyon sp.]|uniref:glycosyl-4,4'-diaponeurosporenoate acyltransferase CrtO family protein n=1 Tax=uncultured Thiodictyon sp. TaxID=1846217 RepID=UPI0025E26B8F|nr:hypothetical protein [uncultured Thiodictyon sp.]